MNANMSFHGKDEVAHAAYRDMLATIKAEVNDKDRQMMDDAFDLALEAHRPQVRKSGEPYIMHPIAVARICAEEIGLGATAIICALLHDVVEDTDVTLDEIRARFGPSVAKIVDGLTKLDSAYNSDSPQAENFKKVLGTLIEDVRVVLIKMADRLHNMRTLGAMSHEKQLKIAAETSYIYAPLAHRLGLYPFKTEYQDLCMKITDPENYHSIAKKLAETKRARESYIEGFIAPLRERIAETGLKCRIFGRPKSIHSIWNKLRGKDVDFEEIYDLFAVRVVLDVPRSEEKMACWHAYSIITDIHQCISHRLKDWITNPKSNGYESLHTTVVGPDGRFVEVQIRTERMDEIAERGYAAHWKYKGASTGQPDVYEKWLDNVRAILENPHSNAVEFLDDFRNSNLFNEEVLVYTPKGDMITLPKGATALDFAFHIHTDVGYHCCAVKVNGKLVPMGQPLENADQVTVLTNKNQKPSEGWLKMVITGKAKAKIRSAAKEEKRKLGEIAREAFERKCKNLKVVSEEALETLVKHYNYASYVDFFYDLAKETITMAGVFKPFIVENGKLSLAADRDTEPPTGEAKPIRIRKADPAKSRLIIDGVSADQYEYTLASCCNPVQGDGVFAYVSSTGGLRIHRTTCPNATHLMANYGYRVKKATWGNLAGENFVAKLLIEGTDDGPGVIGQLSNTISSVLKLNIVELNIKGREGFFDATLRIQVDNTDRLSKAIHELRSLSFIGSVTRME